MERKRKVLRMDRELFDTIWALYKIHGSDKTYAEYAQMVGGTVSEGSIGNVVRAGGDWEAHMRRCEKNKADWHTREARKRQAQKQLHLITEQTAQAESEDTRQMILPETVRQAMHRAEERAVHLKDMTAEMKETAVNLSTAMGELGQALTHLVEEMQKSGLMAAMEAAERQA